MKPLVINDEAADELDEAIRYYENKGPGIGLNLAVRVSEAFQRIQHNPHLYPFHKDTKVQKCLVRRYQFTVFYMELDEHVVVIAVAHQKRRPDYWKFRQSAINENSEEFEAYGDRKP
ncbi:MAG TPA: type II toxin-antitoxin system RelE/ParE family toxin [Blastocatellia bacterium]|nr:type II toxin-antitoxin system RelE/ParE family toxin [Blastocatellia bacterium]